MNGISYRCIIVLLLFSNSACTKEQHGASEAAQSSLPGEGRLQWQLPLRLQEISGLALTPDGRLFAVDDEQAIIYQIDYTSGRLVKAFAVGKPALRGDFEGIAYLDESLFLVTSGGTLFRFDEGDDGERVAYQKTETGLGEQCEIEGLAQDVKNGRLLLVCKDVHKKADVAALSIFIWRPGSRRVDIDDRIELPIEEILVHTQTEGFHPSGIAVDPLSGAILIVAARQRTVIELDQKGNFVNATMLSPAKWHMQAEGIEITAAGQLIISDEGGRSRAKLTVYDAPGMEMNTHNDQ